MNQKHILLSFKTRPWVSWTTLGARDFSRSSRESNGTLAVTPSWPPPVLFRKKSIGICSKKKRKKSSTHQWVTGSCKLIPSRLFQLLNFHKKMDLFAWFPSCGQCSGLLSPGADPGGLDWVSSHPPLEQPTWKNKRKYGPKKYRKKWLAKTSWSQPAFVLPKSPCFGTNVGQLKVINV